MSILNVFTGPDIVLLGCDTEADFEDGTRANLTKSLVIPHLNAVIGFRGRSFMFLCVVPAFLGHAGTFDELAIRMPELINQASDYCLENLSTPSNELGANFVLSGYSPDAGHMVTHSFVRLPSGEIKTDLDVREFISPDFGASEIPKGIRADKNGMIMLARHQAHLVRERGHTDCQAGGKFLITEIRARGIFIEAAFDFPPR
ncbi:hypothetical protein [Pseudomonas sp. EL_65y_Pfl2_R95]|uniref:hypothetical protein n=1 Tax=Pseudomonas sp. EL_65y_Pfl2_R95 TaxID=3088698 RepID=UPI0030DC1B9F